MKPERILETCLYVGDLDRAEQFYTRILNLELHSREDGRHLFLRCGNQMLLLFIAQQTSRDSSSLPAHGMRGEGHLAFAVSEAEYDSWKKELVSKHIEIEKEVAWPHGGRSFYFRDPSGNSLEFATPATWRISEADLFG